MNKKHRPSAIASTVAPLATVAASSASTMAPKYGRARQLLNSEVAVSRMLDFLIQTPDPDELLAKAGIRRHQLRSLELDDEVAQALETRKDAVCAISWRLEPNQSIAGRYISETIKPHIDTLVADILDAVPYGYSVQEAVYQADGTRIGLSRIVQKPMEWFEPMPDGSLRYYPEDGTGGMVGIECDPRKFFLSVRRPKYQNPRGEALLSRLYFPVTWRREGWGMWLHFLETFGDPIVLGQVPDFRAFVEAMKAQGVRSTIAWQSTSDRDSVSTINASAPGEFERLENAIIKRIQKLLLGQTLTSDVSTGGGSYAQAAVHNQVRHDKTKADVRLVTRVMQRLVDVLCEINGFPTLRFIMADDAGLEAARAARDAVLYPVLSGSGFQLTRSYFTDVYDYRDSDLEVKSTVEPPLVSGDSVLPDATDITPVEGRSVADDGREGEAASKNEQVGAPAAIRRATMTFAEPKMAPVQAAVDRLTEEAITRLKNHAGGRWPLVESELRSAIRDATDRNDLERRLLAILPDASKGGEFATLLAVADFACRAIGYVGGQARLA